MSEMKNSEIRGEDAAQESTSSSSAAPSSSSSSSPAPSSSLQPEMRKESAVSTSSDWSWPSVQGQVGGQEEATQSGKGGRGAQGRDTCHKYGQAGAELIQAQTCQDKVDLN